MGVVKGQLYFLAGRCCHLVIMLPTLDNVGCITSLSEGVMLSTLDNVGCSGERALLTEMLACQAGLA